MLPIETSHIESALRAAAGAEARQIYFGLLQDPPSASVLAQSRDFLERQLQEAAELDSDLPQETDALPSWMDCHIRQVGQQYREYLDQRRAGSGRRYFRNKSHALYFLKAVAPTKMVDGAWLYGLLQRWDDTRFTALIRIYLEELGEGVPDKNHVVLYRQLLLTHGCDQWQHLDDNYFIQGAIQLSLAHHASIFLPEVIGFNLGYEQLPLHLLITARELNELGIDPYYFTLHVTVDNAASGHACKALQGLSATMPRVGNRRTFWRRMENGYRLNMLGEGSASVIAGFDTERELLAMLSSKSMVGRHLHSDYCRVAGKSVNEWLANPAQLPAFLDSLQQTGWIRRNQPPERSRFWNLIHGDHAEMYGVFSAYEKQLVHDWIAGDINDENPMHHLAYRARQRLLDSLQEGSRERRHRGAFRNVFREHFSHRSDGAGKGNDFNTELRQLEQQLAALQGKEAVMDRLVGLMSPLHHHTAAGLMATRIFGKLL